MEGARVSFEAGLNCSASVFLVLVIVEAIATVAVVTEFTVCKAFTVSGRRKQHNRNIINRRFK